MKRTRTTRSLLRHTLIASAAIAAAAAVTGVATPEAHASAATAVAGFLGGKLISGAFNMGAGFLWSAVFGDASSSGLTSTDLEAIQDIVDAELTAHELESEIDDADAVLYSASEYFRGTDATDLDLALTKITPILNDTSTLLQHLDDHGLNGSSTYVIMASLRVAFLKELHNVYAARNALSPGYYSASTLGSALANVSSQAGAFLSQLETFEPTFDAQFGSITLEGTMTPSYSHYCFSGPDGDICGTSFQYAACSVCSSGTLYSAQDVLEGLQEARVLLQQAKMSYRDSQLAPQYYELKRNLTRIANGDFEYCGNGTCAIGEIDSCADDCAGQFDEIGNFTKNISGPSTLGSTSEASLQWQADGNLVLYDVTTSPASIRWQADLLTGTTGYKVVFTSSSGNLLIRDSSGSKLWGALTSGLGSDGRLVLLGKTLYLMNGDGTYNADGTLNGTGQRVWSSDADSHRYAELEDRFCYDTSATITVLQSITGKLKWTGSGELQAYSTWTTGSTSGSTLTWSTGTSGAYLCNQEDGSLVIYDSMGNTLWSSGTGRGVGGRLVMVGDQLRTTTDSGDLMWTSPTCSGASCTQDNRIASLSTSTFTTLTKSQAQTLLENDKARLDWESDGNLALYNKSTGATIYESGTAGTGAKLVHGPSGLSVKDSSNQVQWTLSIAGQAGSVVLADCNLFAAGYSTGEALGATDTSCDDTAN